jgi:hypothetical protein
VISEIWQTGIKNCLNKSFLLEQLKELMYRTENYFNTVVTFFTDQLPFQRFLGTQVMCLHFVQGPEMTHSYSINILSLQLTLLIEKMLF